MGFFKKPKLDESLYEQDYSEERVKNSLKTSVKEDIFIDLVEAGSNAVKSARRKLKAKENEDWGLGSSRYDAGYGEEDSDIEVESYKRKVNYVRPDDIMVTSVNTDQQRVREPLKLTGFVMKDQSEEIREKIAAIEAETAKWLSNLKPDRNFDEIDFKEYNKNVAALDYHKKFSPIVEHMYDNEVMNALGKKLMHYMSKPLKNVLPEDYYNFAEANGYYEQFKKALDEQKELKEQQIISYLEALRQNQAENKDWVDIEIKETAAMIGS